MSETNYKLIRVIGPTEKYSCTCVFILYNDCKKFHEYKYNS